MALKLGSVMVTGWRNFEHDKNPRLLLTNCW